MRKILLFGLPILLLACTNNENQANQEINKEVEKELLIKTLKQDVSFLANDSLEGREIGTQGEIIAANYIADRFKEIGLVPKGDSSTYFQLFSRKTKAHPHDTSFSGEEVTGRNVIGIIDNHKPTTIVIGAHYDHLGWGDEGSLHTTHSEAEKAIHNGADDNASGVAALLRLARELKTKELSNNVLFVAFTGEEKGLWGSNYFVKNATVDIDQVNFMVNMDMVGRLDTNRRLAVFGVGTSPSFIPAVEKIKEPEFTFKYDSSGIGPSDHTSFYLEDVPVIHFFTGQHKDYHKPTDDTELINFEGLNDVASFIFNLIVNLDQEDKLAFQKTKEKENKARSFNVTLGVIPDYLFDGRGMKIDGTKQDRPAENAGIMKGDIVIKMGEKDINSMNDYMDALGIFNPKETIKVIVKRDNKNLEFEVTFD